MCILIRNIWDKITKEEFDNCFKANPDWFWCAVKNKWNLKYFKSLSQIDSWDYYNEIKEYEEIILHFRIGTSWTKDLNNVHPFLMNNYTLFFHNGVISSPKPRDEMSDTHTLCDNIYKLKLNTKDIFEDDWVIDNLLNSKVGNYNKFIVINSVTPTKIYWESLWHYREQTWFSNYSYTNKPTYWWYFNFQSSYTPSSYTPYKKVFTPEYKKEKMFD
jgi:predicted glutamine amidotransferase